MSVKGKVKAVAYLRTSSAANVGADKDSERRQRAAIKAYAVSSGFELVAEFNDPAVKGTDAIEARPGFSALLDRIETNGTHTVLVEDASRLARSVLVQELAIIALKARGVRVLASNGDDLTETDDEMKVAMRQMAAAFAQLEKSRLVKKLRAARDRMRINEVGKRVKVEGRKSHKELNPQMVQLAKELHRYPVKGRRRSLRDVAAELAAHGFAGKDGKAFAAMSVKRMVAA
jgi:DNA invertase Pin-like site-specific DNA recombinase